jgi:protease-4
MMTGLVNDLGGQMTSAMNASRKKLSGRAKELVDQGLFTDDEALKKGLIDRLDYGDVLLSELRVKMDGSENSKKTGFTPVEEYMRGVTQPKKSRAVEVAVIHIQGVITEDGGASPLTLDEKSANATEIAQLIRDAASDKYIKVIVLRVNSPGGSPSASETIRRAITWAKDKKGRPVIVSMGALAASGGYWLSADANRIYADAATLTGSIGVVGGKFDLSGVFDKYGINWDGTQYGSNAGMWAMNKPFNAVQQAKFEESLDNIYAHFISIVAHGRKMKPEDVEKIARGHVWSGLAASKSGLVDQIGGFDVAMDDVAKRLGKKNRYELAVQELPKPETPLQALYSLTEQGLPFGSVLPRGLTETFSAYLPFFTNDRMVYTPLPRL